MTIFRNKKAIATTAISAAIATIVTASPASAATSGSKSFGDCTLSMRLVLSNHYSTWVGNELTVRAQGNVKCAKRHGYTNLTVAMKVDGRQTEATSARWSNSFGTGSGWVSTSGHVRSAGNDGTKCRSYQGVMTVGIAGLGASYVTTGSPASLCY